MTMTTNDRQAEILARVRDDFLESMPAHFERLRWIQGQLIEFQTQRLRALLGVAIDASPFHRPRLTGVDPNTFTLSDLGSLPVMTKTEMMAAYDDVVTDPRLNLEAVNRHVEALGDQPLLHLDRYVVLASGGSSGVRGVYACDLTGAAQHTAAVIRGGLDRAGSHDRLATAWSSPDGHRRRSLLRSRHSQPVVDIPSRSPLRHYLCPGHTAVRRDHPTSATSPTHAPHRPSIGYCSPGRRPSRSASDLAIIEHVDTNDQAIAAGASADHILVTNLFNQTQPLIRYRIDDMMTPAPAALDHAHQRATVQGRNDEHLDVVGVQVHPIAIRSILTTDSNVADYQVHASQNGEIHVTVVPVGKIDHGGLETAISPALEDAGAPPTKITVTTADEIPRNPVTGKTPQFVNG